MPHVDPWPEVERIAAERGYSLDDASDLVRRTTLLLVDSEHAIGNTLLLHLNMGRTMAEALQAATAEVDAAIVKRERDA